MITPEIFEQQAKELAAMNTMQFAMPPDKGYILAAVVQAAAICLELPKTTQAFCKEFVNEFCDRYREQMPMVVKAIDDAWQGQLVTADEFEEILDKKWERIAQEVEQEMGGEVKIIVDKPHQGALCPINGEPCSKEGNFYYYPNDCPDWVMCEETASELQDEFPSVFAVAPPNHDPETFDY